jgi:glycine/D-amino acid oxidase-like deaminating enzyme
MLIIWSGYSSDSHPFVGEVPGKPNVFISAGFQGHGMVMCFLCAKALVQIMVRKVDQSVNGLGRLRDWFPFVYNVTEERMILPFKGRV